MVSIIQGKEEEHYSLNLLLLLCVGITTLRCRLLTQSRRQKVSGRKVSQLDSLLMGINIFILTHFAEARLSRKEICYICLNYLHHRHMSEVQDCLSQEKIKLPDFITLRHDCMATMYIST